MKALLARQGFTVKGEVRGCDVAATRGDLLWVVELKLHFNVTLLYQATERLTLTPHVFVAIPRPRSERDKNYRLMIKILKKLELGLITVALDSALGYAQIVLFPDGSGGGKPAAAARVRTEIARRAYDTAGGSKTKVMTAFRERCIRIACLLSRYGALTAAVLVRAYGCGPDTHGILYRNRYGWFIRAGKGLYGLSPAGEAYLYENAGTEVVAHYRGAAEGFL